MAVFASEVAQQIVERKSQTNFEGRIRVALINGKQEGDRPRQMRRELQQQAALAARFMHQLELELLEIAQSAVNQFGRPAAGAAGKVARFDQYDFKATQGGVARRGRSVDSTADDGKIE